MEITPQSLIELTYNFYGLKADLSAAAEFLRRNVLGTPGAFVDWMAKQDA